MGDKEVSFYNLASSHNVGNNINKLANTWKYHKVQDSPKWEVVSTHNSPLNFLENFDWIDRKSATKRLTEFHSDSERASKQPRTTSTNRALNHYLKTMHAMTERRFKE